MRSVNRILIVDDEPHVRKFLSLLAKTALGAAEVAEAADRAEAAHSVIIAKPDLVLLDINLIGASGLDVLQDLHASQPDLPVVMVTSVNTRRAVEEALQRGACGYILKDTPHHEIAETLRTIAARELPSADA